MIDFEQFGLMESDTQITFIEDLTQGHSVSGKMRKILESLPVGESDWLVDTYILVRCALIGVKKEYSWALPSRRDHLRFGAILQQYVHTGLMDEHALVKIVQRSDHVFLSYYESTLLEAESTLSGCLYNITRRLRQILECHAYPFRVIKWIEWRQLQVPISSYVQHRTDKHCLTLQCVNSGELRIEAGSE